MTFIKWLNRSDMQKLNLCTLMFNSNPTDCSTQLRDHQEYLIQIDYFSAPTTCRLIVVVQSQLLFRVVDRNGEAALLRVRPSGHPHSFTYSIATILSVIC